MELDRGSIDFDHRENALVTCISVKLMEKNGMILKAKAELIGDIIDGVLKIVDGKQAEFEEIYGTEVVKNAHHNYDKLPDDYPAVISSRRKTVDSQEVQQKLLDRAFDTENQNGKE